MITITIDGNTSVINKLLPKYAAAHGWTDGQVDENGDAITVLSAAEKGIQSHIRSTVQRQVTQEAKQAAIAQASQAANAEMDEVTVTVTES